MQKAMYVIGISGVSNGGKSTLTGRITKAFQGSYCVCQDDYFVEEGNDKLVIDPELNEANWESFDALNMEKMLADLTEYLKTKENYLRTNLDQTPHFVFVEGFTIFNYRPFNNIWSKKYFITLEKEEAHRRRSLQEAVPAIESGRIYVTPDCPGYFDKIMWPMYELHREELREQADIVYMDGTDSRGELYNQILKDLIKLVPKDSTTLRMPHSW